MEKSGGFGRPVNCVQQKQQKCIDKGQRDKEEESTVISTEE